MDVDGDGNIAEDEVYSESWSDGAGRTLMSRTEHPGSTGGWSATLAEYDILGRVTRQSVPTETNSSYELAGDDLTRGFLWTHQKYDWMNRVIRKINTDGTDSPTLNDSDVLISYEGCGCAGGLVTTVEGELVPRTDATGNARRKQKSYADILGRTFKAETFEWDGDVYSTIHQSFNGRDEILRTRQYAGNTSSTTYQDTTATFDGHGRMATSHKPEQRDSSNNLKYTTYNYNPDDSILNVTDGRGAVTNFEYNSRGLPTEKSWTVPGGSGITDPSDVTFTYDNLGNRTAMTDGMGEVDYEYNSLSQMTAEVRDFADTLANEPGTGVYRIDYGYGLTGQLKTLTEPFGEVINYHNDEMGRLTAVDPTTAYGDLPQNNAVVSGMEYRAFGSLKEANYGNGTQATMTYNNRLQPITYRLVNTSNSQILFGKDYEYTTGSNNDNDGRIKRSVHIDDTLSTENEQKQNRRYTYDHQGRVKTAEAGEYACYSFGCTPRNGPFRQTYHYNAFGEKTQIDDWDFGFNTPGGGPGCYGCPRWFNYSETITNNRTTSSGLATNDPAGGQAITTYEHDNDGRLVNRDGELYAHDATGRLTGIDRTAANPDVVYFIDGNGKTIKWTESGTVKNYYVRSTLLDDALVTLSATGGMETSSTFSPHGLKLATVQNNELKISHRDPAAENVYAVKMDKTTAGGIALDPTGRTPSVSSPGGICVPPGCTPPNGSPGGMYGGFDGMAMLTSMILSQRMRDRQFWNLDPIYVKVGFRVTLPGDGRPENHDFPLIDEAKAAALYLVAAGATRPQAIYAGIVNPNMFYKFN